MTKASLTLALLCLATSARANWPSYPEMDPSLTAAGLTLLAGSLLVVFGRGKR
ncbi:MAG: LPXTG cell wall anchor domain-containing protein [Elusimicrobia bacterium]|nr:LPXTG cell wall anchor domain-containing protein [Elusimicrobiota bacterium]